jgi:hypothetical protein
MTHVSRPFQVGLAVVAVFAAVWLVALRGHSNSGGSTPSAAPAQAPRSSEPAPTTSSPYSGSAPGIAGLTRAIEKARGAVALSERNAHQLQQQSAQASSATVTPSGTSAAQRASSPAASHVSSAAAPQRSTAAKRSASQSATSRATATKTAPRRAPAQAVARGALPMQAKVERQLEAGQTVAILFWNPHAVVDQVVRSELQAAQRAFHGRVAVDVAEASQAGGFGSFTHAVQVLETPTILLVNGRGQTSSLTGLTDSFSLQQAISEARR